MNEQIILGSDHAGFPLKTVCLEHLQQAGYLCEDLGTDSGSVSCDYPKFAAAVCERVRETGARGVLVCGSGIGMSMAANRFSGIRAALCWNEFTARVSRAHNKANVLCLGARVIGPGLALSVLDVFLQTGFEGGRHQQRIQLFDEGIA
ncbi:MAG: ribose 5-phosphate isomerase B [Desulfohalobiaceae bacterium]|nr:ribose 5-phosphate isomerase B [Desulfohalobiaceae bacterium]